MICGAGGVGKTTMAAALGTMAAIHLGGRVLVAHGRPGPPPGRRARAARRIGNDERPGAAGGLRATPALKPRGELWVAMLDTKASWDDLIRRHAPDARTRDAILANPLYENITGRFVQSHDYIAMERLHELHASGRYDLIVVDTPPIAQRARLPRRAGPHGRVLRQPPAALADRCRTATASSTLASQPFLTSGRPDPRLPVPAGHRRVLRRCSRRWRRASSAGPARSRSCWATPARRSASSPRWRPRRPTRPASSSPSCSRRKLPLGAVVAEQGAARRPAARRPPRRSPSAFRDERRRPGRRRGRARRRRRATRRARVLAEVAESFANYAVVADARGRAARRAGRHRGRPRHRPDPRRADVNDLAGLVRLGQCCWR